MTVDRIFGACVCVLALLFLTLAVPSISDDWKSAAGTEYFVVGPHLFPNIAGGLCLVMGLLIALHPTDSHKLAKLRDAKVRRNVLLTVVLSLGYAALLNILGFTLTTVLVLSVFFVVFGEHRWFVVAPMAVIVPVVTKLVFLRFFMLELPPGLFEWLPI